MDIAVVEKIVNLGGLAALAAFSLWLLNKTWEGRVNDNKAHASQSEKLLGEVLNALRENTKAFTELKAVIEERVKGHA